MHKNVYMIIITLLCTAPSTCNAHNFVKKVTSFLQGRMAEKIDQQEYDASSITTLSITALAGSISVKTGPKKSLFVRTITRAKKSDDLHDVSITVTEKNNHLALRTKKKNKKKKRITVDYEVIVPASLNLALTITGCGDVMVKDVQGTIDVVANDTVTIHNTKKAVSAQTLKKGNITVINAQGPVETLSNSGNIFGENIAQNFFAQTIKGNILVHCKTVPSDGQLDLKSIAGNIILGLPTNTSAEILGHTMYGTLISDHCITLKSFATPLNKTAWNKFKKEVDGTLGSGQATIALHSTNGNIKIVETKIT